MDRIAMVALVFIAGLLIGGLGWERLQLRDANSEWQQAVKRTQDANREALAAERRLAEAKTKRDAESKALEAAVNASTSDCPTPDDEQRLLDSAADETRSRRGSSVAEGRVQ